MSTPVQITQAKPGRWIYNAYGAMCPFSADKSRILLIDVDHYVLWDRRDGYVHDLPIPADAESVWLRDGNEVFTYVAGKRFNSFDIATGKPALIRSFDEYDTISGLGESDISEDGNHFIFCGNSSEVFVYTLASDTKTIIGKFPPGSFNQLYLTPDNNVLIGFYQKGTARFCGLEVYDQNGKFVRQALTSMSHMDTSRKPNGDEVIVCSNGDVVPGPTSGMRNGVISIGVMDGQQEPLLELGWSPLGGPASDAIDVSCSDRGHAYISTYAQDRNAPYANQVIKVPLDGSAVQIICPTGDVPDSYNRQPKASASWDGTELVFASGTTPNPLEVNTFLVVMDTVVPGPVPAPAPILAQDIGRIDYGKFLTERFDMRVRNGTIALAPREDGGLDMTAIVDIFDKKRGS